MPTPVVSFTTKTNSIAIQIDNGVIDYVRPSEPLGLKALHAGAFAVRGVVYDVAGYVFKKDGVVITGDAFAIVDALDGLFKKGNSVTASTASNIANNENNYGVYRPVIKVSGLSGATGVSNHESGGIVATVAGTNGSGDLYLPRGIDSSKPWKIAILVEVNDSQPITNLAFTNFDNNFGSGLKMTEISTTMFDGQFAGGVFLAQYGVNGGGIPTGTKVWIGMCSDGVEAVSAFLIPYNAPTKLFSALGFQSAWDGSVYCTTSAITTQSGGVNSFGGTNPQHKLCRLNITTKSTQNRVIGVYANQGLSNPTDGLLNPPFVMLKNKVLQDNTGFILYPGAHGSKTTDLVMNMHGYDAVSYTRWELATSGAELIKLYTAGYLCFGIMGTSTGIQLSATASNWGAAAGMRYRKAQLEWIRANIPLTRYLFCIGQSMGALNVLNWVMQYPDTVKAAYLISAAADLSDSFTNRGYATQIQKGYSAFYVCIQAGTGQAPASATTFWTKITYGNTAPDEIYYNAPYVWRDTYNSGTAYAVNDIVAVTSALTASQLAYVDPVKNGDNFKNFPIKMVHGDSDTNIPIVQATNLQTAINTTGGNVTLRTVAGANHLVAALFDGNEMVSFFAANS